MDRLYFFSGSAEKYPGKGVNEYVSCVETYKELSQIIGWRKQLSNFWVEEFEVEGMRWNTVEHMFQSYKLNIGSPDIAFQLTLNSGSKLSQGTGLDARKQRKAVVLNHEQLKEWNIIKDDVLYAALSAKFSQHEYLNATLLLTGNAELWHGMPRVPRTRQHLLEIVREEI